MKPITDEKAWLNELLKNGHIELRVFKGKEIKSGIYDDIDSLIKNIKYAMGERYTIYNTINPSSLKATNEILQPFKKTTKNKDITAIKNIFFDFDPVREKGIPATQKQVVDSIAAGRDLVTFLYKEGFPLPINQGFSGNGAHVYFKCDLSVDDKPLIDDLYTLLNKRFDSDEISFDTSVRNSARIARTFGTVNYKSNKRAKCLFYDGATSVSKDVLNAVVSKFTPAKVKPRHFITDNSITTAGIKPDHNILAKCSSLNPVFSGEQGKYFIDCINKGSHSTQGAKDSVLWVKDNGFYTYHCSHDGCSNIKSKEFNEYLK